MCDEFDRIDQVTTGNSSKGRTRGVPVHWAIAVLFALIAAACGSTSDVDSSQGAAANTAEEPAPSDQPDAPTSRSETQLVDLAGGGQLDWNSIQGRDVVLWFWAPW